MAAPVRLGCVKYLNARPLIHGWDGPVQFDHPSALCRQLASGELDIALVSSFEYLRNPIYAAVDGVAIASDGPVYSVIVAHLAPLNFMREVVVDPASETSINLLQCLLGERELAPALVREGEITTERGQLLIGDQAIRFREESDGRHRYYDLGAAWQEQTSLPFVYALWLIRPEFARKEKVAAALRSLGEKNLANLEAVIAAQPEADPAFCEFYFRECLRFGFGESEKNGFKKFGELCAQHHLLPAAPPDIAVV
ncbi:MAG: menaquinone biosynthesis protein [Chthoniobacterales bacterium]|nr:menaquinone biosynthesis protein [Chthoniobacterales bacterium]